MRPKIFLLTPIATGATVPGMKLEAWRQTYGYTYAELAMALGIEGRNPGRTVHRFCTEESIPNRKMIRRIEKVTEGQVRDEDFPLEFVGKGNVA